MNSCKHHHHISDSKAQEMLTSNGINRTPIKIALLVLLSKTKQPQSVKDLYQKLTKFKCNISTVFRSIKQFQEKGMLRELNLGEDYFRYELINQNDKDHHHHHIRCRDCGDIKVLEQCDVSLLEKILGKSGFTNTEHYLEFTGNCPKCS